MKNIPRIKNILMEQIELLHQGTAAAAKTGTEDVLAISSLLGEHVKAYLSACHLENSEGEDSPAKLVKRILDEGSGRKGCFPKEFTKKVNDGEEPVILNWPRKYEAPVKGGEPHDGSNGEEQRPD